LPEGKSQITEYGGIMVNTQELRRKRVQLGEKGNRLIDEAEKAGRDLTKEEREQLDSWLDEAKGLSVRIEQEESRNAAEMRDAAIEGRPIGKTFGRENLPELRSYLGGGEHSDISFGSWLKGVMTGRWSGASAETRAMVVGDGGGYLVPQPLFGEIFADAMGKARVIEAGARVIRMDSMTLRAPKITGYPTSEWLGELEEATPSDFTFDKEDITAKKCSIQCDMSVELAEDSPLFTETVDAQLSRAIALAVDKAALVGAVGGPLGIVNQPSVQVIAGVGALDSYGPFSQAWGAVEGANYTPTALLAHPWLFATLDSLTADTDGQPLQPPRSWTTYKQLPTTQLDLTPGSSTVETMAVLGDWKQFLWGIRTDARVEVSREAGDAWAKYGVKVRIYFRGNCVAIHPQAFCVLTGVELPSLPEEEGS
jgi:HK97 family phage major capsid protein